MDKHTLLITNDDGIDARGLEALVRLAEPLGEGTVVAPLVERSGVSHALTLNQHVTTTPAGPRRFAVDGTPVDCVLLGVKTILDRKPACLLSGINHGLNLGRDTSYSGTVAAAIEGACLGIPSVAISCKGEAHLPLSEEAAEGLTGLIRNVIQSGLPEGVCLNVNIPPGRIQGLRLASLGFDGMHVEVMEEPVPSDSRSLRFVGRKALTAATGNGTDAAVLTRGWIAVTPIKVDRTAHEHWAAVVGLESGPRGSG